MVRRTHLLPGLLLLLAAVSSACNNVPLFAPAQSTITVSAGRRTLALNSSVEVTAVVVEPSGTPVQNGTTVRFTTTLGRVDPIEVETRNGIATTTFFAGDTSGVAELTALSGAVGGATSSGNGGGATTATNLITFTIGAAAADTVTISARPSTVPAGGGTVEVNAVVRDASGQGLSGVPVTFSATQGTLSSTIATTDISGVATVGLTTSVETSISAVSGSKSTATPATVTVLGAPSVTLVCQGSGTTATTSCSQTVDVATTFTATRASTSTQLASATLEFGDGSTASLGTLTSASTVSHVYQSVNTYTATLRATDVNGQVTTASVAVNSVAAAVPSPLTVIFSTQTTDAATSTGQRANLALTVTAAGESNIPIESVSWNFGDSVTATTSGLSTSHVYDASTSSPAPTSTATRTYVVTATVRTRDGRSGTARTEIQIKLNASVP